MGAKVVTEVTANQARVPAWFLEEKRKSLPLCFVVGQDLNFVCFDEVLNTARLVEIIETLLPHLVEGWVIKY